MSDRSRKRSRRGSTPSHNSIACESCRTKKRRCDRSIPVCNQCHHDPSQCHYPEQNKRGLPLGYVNKLEARLAETEAALVHIIDRRHATDTWFTPNVALHPQDYTGSMSKADRAKEWDAWPLHDASSIGAWHFRKSKQVNQQTNNVAANDSAIIGGSNNKPSRNPTKRRRQSDLDSGASQEGRNRSDHVNGGLLVGDVLAADHEPSSRAQRLCQAQPDMYF
ncbi:uncharacterized protein F5Z01DRAFT_201655 [Emericellopsis atlantica]|uniref:Zn(2)-C6 fungal-type domain-containing protein n=1 Tax=Emericellopsis atlantica TaxID=2614577 RepID=A0A9P7ZUM5_9HYPO|nr:uncharacterized protein F5Z01DRAFT_201655 [Emericellopsis atlantica]KAG9258550.1 hypothetical protein F5Z01DRAFT_201655 [Emericellopsis atlantica]